MKLAHIADGGPEAWKTSIVLVNPDAVNPITATVQFHSTQQTNAGPEPLVPLEKYTYAPDSPLEVQIPPASSVTIRTQGTSGTPLWTGWAQVDSRSPIAGFAVFRGQSPEGIQSEATVPLQAGGTTRFFMPVENLNGRGTSMAVVNSSGTRATLKFRDPDGTTLSPPSGSASWSLPLNGHTSFSLLDLPFGLNGKSGLAEFTGDGYELLGLGFRFDHERHVFTSLPVIRR
jgi:hypothetical protein